MSALIALIIGHSDNLKKVTPKLCSFCDKQAVSYSSPDHYCQEHRDQYWEWANNLPTKAELKRVLDNDKPY